jgi:acetyl-CoA carboxylase biotin carboxylase subunit
MIKRVLIANRGEIAVRIMRACRELGIETVLVYSDADADSVAVEMAGHAVYIGLAAPNESYLRGDKIIAAALETGCDAVHPGFGFLSENAEFAQAARDAGLIFVGPSPDAIRAMGLKTTALETARRAGVPTLPSYEGDDPSSGAREIGYPVLVKAAAGGGGKGMRIVRDESELRAAVESAQREAQKAFGDARVFIEKYIENARHIEIQVFADAHGSTVHLFERECSIQRRHQKIIEESPSPYLSPEQREAMGEAAVQLARAVGYTNAGTVEFIVDDANGKFYFLEMNTRLQVEHPVTELVTGLDLVKLQFRVANGEPLPFTRADLNQRGHAIECRIYAEDPANDFLPAPGKILTLIEPRAPGVRVDSGVRGGDEITVHYDPMIAKLITYGATRAEATEKMITALQNYVILGTTTNIPFLIDMLQDDDYVKGNTTTNLIARRFAGWRPRAEISDTVLIAAALSELLSAPMRANGAQSDMATVADPWARMDGFRL